MINFDDNIGGGLNNDILNTSRLTRRRRSRNTVGQQRGQSNTHQRQSTAGGLESFVRARRQRKQSSTSDSGYYQCHEPTFALRRRVHRGLCGGFSERFPMPITQQFPRRCQRYAVFTVGAGMTRRPRHRSGTSTKIQPTSLHILPPSRNAIEIFNATQTVAGCPRHQWRPTIPAALQRRQGNGSAPALRRPTGVFPVAEDIVGWIETGKRGDGEDTGELGRREDAGGASLPCKFG